ncbi:AbiJ-NTD4 domain-containing protein [Nitrosomonas sp. Nm58]|uniref:AbiJ-NTD4 domain-containing protein n=1 Tax=Nitrosomonas sp. Nm58 TaxID=200126 RepID=UPI0008979C68|nr:hypothetical protein [Nitrosomonas sp. Nm58]SDY14869.1 hypothetical protein SAMN05421754_1002108 [Nitrosomonas sp. Nm58]
MPKFSSRYGYNPKDAKAPILEEAPEWLRIGYINGILEKLLYVDNDSRYTNKGDRPLGTKELLENYCLLLRQEPGEAYYDSWFCIDSLKELLKEAPWYSFYDFVELAAKKIREQEQYRMDDAWISQFGVARYIKQVNNLFEEERIAWRLNSNCELIREIPSAYATALEGAEKVLSKNEFEPARKHYRKAIRYVYQHPLDPENGIKEIVSSVESIGKTLYPGAATLGDVVKALRKDDRFPQTLVSVIDKFYTFANAEPAIRHGGVVPSKVSLDDAEFSLHVGVALIRFLLSKNNRGL